MFYYVDTKGQSSTAFSSFVGADPGLDLGIMYSNANAQLYSFINQDSKDIFSAAGRRFPGSTGSMDPEDYAERGG
ncbi:MAG: hypothetical protein NVSMB24_34140 [Mucilaginibacter sp.]